MSAQSIIHHARFIGNTAERGLQFRGEQPVMHASHNHVHLWALEWWADPEPGVNLDVQCDAVDFIVAR